MSSTDRANCVKQCNTFVTDRDGSVRTVAKGSRPCARHPLETSRDIPDANGVWVVLAWEPDGAAFGGAVDSPNRRSRPMVIDTYPDAPLEEPEDEGPSPVLG